jgi:hypothetical protein
MHALEVLDGLGASSTQLGRAATPAPIQPQRIVSLAAPSPRPEHVPEIAPELAPEVHIPRAPRAPSEAELLPRPDPGPRAGTRLDFPAPSVPGLSGGAPAPAGARAGDPASGKPGTASSRSTAPGTSLPPYRVEPRGGRVWSSPPPLDVEAELVETLSLPAGLRGEPPPPDEPPRSAAATRLACTSLARELGRELRARYGVTIRTDLDGLEVAQRYLREALVDARARTPEDRREVMRHGALVGELLARRLGARWVEVESVEAGRWAMLVPSRSRADEVLRVWPFARVLRFVAMGHRERDLVSYFLELEGRSR